MHTGSKAQGGAGDMTVPHSRLACVSGLRAIAAAAAAGPPDGHGRREAARWSGLADTIAASLRDAVHAGMLECAVTLSRDVGLGGA